MKIIHTAETDFTTLPQQEQDQIYNGLDVCVTHDVFSALYPQLDHTTSQTYDFSRELQGPILEMGIRGVLVDQERKAEIIEELYTLLERLEEQLNRIVFDGVGLLSFNWQSWADLRNLFYEVLGLPPETKQGRVTVDRAARDNLQVYPKATQIVKHINALTEIGDKISVLRTGVDQDNRFRTQYNIAGTKTGRLSSSFSSFGTGGNLQNVEESLRSIFIADPGMKFAKFDAKSGESFIVGALEWNLFNDSRYLDACESGDPHTAVARLCWPKLPWTGNIDRDRRIAEQPFYRHYTYRFTCKKLGHGSNYEGQPETLSEQSRVPIDIVAKFQERYFTEFPAHRQWQAWTKEQVKKKGYLISLTGRKRYFFGRRTDPETLRQAIDYDPQCSLADIVNIAMLKIWKLRTATLMMNDHDALTFMYPEKDEDNVIPRLRESLLVSIRLAHGRVLNIPYDVKVGWNKGEASAANPDGLSDYHGHDNRQRSRRLSLFDRLGPTK